MYSLYQDLCSIVVRLGLNSLVARRVFSDGFAMPDDKRFVGIQGADRDAIVMHIALKGAGADVGF